MLRKINTLPDALHRGVWPVMQFGSLASVGAMTSLVSAAGHSRRAIGVAVGGGGAWLLCKPVKRLVRRPRPNAVQTTDLRIRGRAQSGLGYPSGHAAVAAAVASALVADRRGAAVGLLTSRAGAVALSRVNVGAHYPLDAIGGSALGVVTGLLGR